MSVHRSSIRTRPRRDGLPARTARLVGLAGYLAAVVLPLALWHEPIAAIAADFRMELGYLVTGWTAYSLIALGLLFFLPVLVSIGRHPESRLYPRSRNAYAGWGITLYLLGFALASQVAQIAAGPGSH